MSFHRRNWMLVATLTAVVAAAPCCVAQEAPAATGEAAAQQLSLASMFSDHMVLQRDMKLPIWGKAAPDAKVTVQLGEAKQEATADGSGKWRVTVGPLKAGGAPLELTVNSGDQSLDLKDILVGEVWVASGQSNMEWT